MLPNYLKKPPMFYGTDDIHRTLQPAPEADLKVLQEATETPIGFQGRFDIAAGYIVELGQWALGKEQSR